ncbi:protein TIFY 5A-like [Lycium barbarum]|uniref:protein TIFY 5A-like n=1 Tax=Lycium barbarum TaxID=112863 RepID=UPI00293E86EA|nr:protein TIFY 5A-like [Lycium barbarum]
MRKKCNLELRLVPPACVTMGDKESIDQEKQQQLTIFYDGKVVVSDATELQARAIIHLASREAKGNIKTPSSHSETPSPLLQSPSPLLQSPTGLSMKRSLQKFLQKRKNRAEAISPYHH